MQPTARWFAFLAPLAVTACVEPAAAPAPHTDELGDEALASVEDPTLPSPPQEVTRMPLGTLFNYQQSGQVLLYDVRPSFVSALGRIPGSIRWPKARYADQLPAREEEIRAANAAGTPVVLYCTDLACPDAREVAGRLAARGHQVSILAGGWEAWKAGELPVER